MATSSPSCSGRVRSRTSPSTFTASAARARPAPIEAARSAPLEPSGSSLEVPSGSTTCMRGDASPRPVSRCLRTGVRRALLRFEPIDGCMRNRLRTESDTARSPSGRAVEDVIMRPTTTTALALAGTALALPAGVALAETNDDPPSPAESALAAPFAGQLTLNAQMRAKRREVLVERLTPRIIRTERRTAHVKGANFERRAHQRRLRGAPPRALRDELAKSRRELRRAERAAAAAETGRATAATAAGGATTAPQLEAIAACES